MFAKKRLYILALSLTLILSPLLPIIDRPAQAVEIKDLASCSPYAREAVERLVNQEVISGDNLGNFNPKSSVTRGEMITIIVRALDIETSASPSTATFQDVPSGHWANPYIEAAYAKGIVKGLSNDLFGVNNRCTREEMAAMFVRAFTLLDDSGSNLALPTVALSNYADYRQVSTWAQDTMGFALYSGLLFGTSTTTISPRAMAAREQAAVLVDRFLSRYASIKADRLAAGLLKKAADHLTDASVLGNHSTSKTQFNMWVAQNGIPQEFSVTTDTVNEGIWPGLMHSTTSMEMPGLPQEDYPPYAFEQYLVDKVVYEKIVDGSTSTGWERFPALTEAEAAQIMTGVKTGLTAMLDPGMIAHQTGQCTVEETTINGTTGYKITYTGSISDLEAYLLDVLPALMPQDTSSPQNWMQDMINTFSSANYTQIYYIGSSNGKLLGTDLKVQVACKQTNNTDIVPIKTMTINAVTDKYRYDGINISLPDDAKNAPEK